MNFILFFKLLLISIASAQAEKEDSKGAGAPKKSGGKKPIITTDIIHGTGELLYDLFDSSHKKFVKPHVDAHWHKVGDVLKPVTEFMDFDKDGSVEVEDTIGHVCSKVGCKQKEVMGHIDAVHKTAKDSVQAAVSKVHEHLTTGTDKVVDHFETAVPSHKGAIPRTPGNLLLFVLLIASVIYTSVKVSLLGVKITWKIFVFSLKMMLCCGCFGLLFRKRQPTDSKAKQPANPKAKANGKTNVNSKKK